MASLPTFTFADLDRPASGTAVVLAAEGPELGPVAEGLEEASGGLIAAAAATARFKGKARKTLSLLAPRGLALDRLVVVGTGKAGETAAADWVKLGGAIGGELSGGTGAATVVLELPGGEAVPAEAAADVALGIMLRGYRFDRYKTKKGEANGEEDEAPREITMMVADPAAVSAAFEASRAAAEGVVLARDLVNEPANALGPVEFAERAAELERLGVAVEILDEAKLKEERMGALLGVAQGSVRPPRVAVMRWDGGVAGAPPIAVIGKGVVFDTGGISIKPAGGMEDMKGDMAGAACVVGLMHALAARKAKANVVGLIGLVENMPDGNAQRPGDIVTSRSGQTIEIINTDAEGRLVLADVIDYARERFEPRLMIDLATLTGAIIVALGHAHAGMFTDDETLAAQLRDAGKATGDTVWHMPLGKDYDKLIDSKVADMKNTGGRWGGSITAAQFLKRFAGDTPWVHLDIAGTGMGAPANEISRTFGSGFGVRLLDRFVADYHEG